jgi:hypothetical protein
MRPQASGMSRYSAAEEITPVRADFVVERRGFEPMAIAGAVRSRANSPFAGQCAKSAGSPRLLDLGRDGVERPLLGLVEPPGNWWPSVGLGGGGWRASDLCEDSRFSD